MKRAELTAVVPDLHDLAVSKCVAGRDKDGPWVSALLRHRLIDLTPLLDRIQALDAAQYPLDRLVA